MIKNRIKEYRAKYDMKQEDLAKLVGVRRETIGNLEKGRYNPSLVLAWNIAKVFNVSIEDIFTVEELVGNQGATARSAAAPHYYQRGGISMTEDEAYKVFYCLRADRHTVPCGTCRRPCPFAGVFSNCNNLRKNGLFSKGLSGNGK